MDHGLVSLAWTHVSYCPLLVQCAAQGADNGFSVVAPIFSKIDNPFASLHNVFLMQTVNGVAGSDGVLCTLAERDLHMFGWYCGLETR